MTTSTNVLILVRGIPGSGKSTFAHTLAAKHNCEVYECDDFFMIDGKYSFDPSKLGYVHRANQARTRSALSDGKTVIVANTLTKLKEINEYVKIANEFNVPVEVYRTTGNFKNVHGVPEEKLIEMRARMVDYPGEFIIYPCNRIAK